MDACELIRLQFDIPKERLTDLEMLMKKTGLTTRKELINNALTLFEWAVKEKEQGNQIASINEKGKKFRELLMPSLNHIK